MNIGTWERKKGLQALQISKNLFEEGMKLVATWLEIFPQWWSSFLTPQITNFHAILYTCVLFWTFSSTSVLNLLSVTSGSVLSSISTSVKLSSSTLLFWTFSSTSVLNLLSMTSDSVLSSIAKSVKLRSSILSSRGGKVLECSLPE